ncbi:MAG TPA: universal stress protein [Vicinamibacterales bacterium]|nr:universal stress protein [Vicinamibacterales bacterium]
MKIQSILCPTDFSEPSRHAMEHAVALAQWSGARIVPLHVQTPAFATVPALDDPAPHLAPGTQLIAGESPADAIAEFATSSRADLIVIGTHGASGFRHLILGSVTESVLRKVDCPVLTVPPRAQSTAKLPFGHLLCAVDFSASSLKALQLACRWAEEGDARLDILHVVDEPDEHALFVARPYDIHHHPEVYERRVAEHLKRVLPPNTCEHSQLHYRITRGNAEDEILRVAAEGGADVIVMGIGRGNSPIFGSTVNHVVRNARCSVLTVR